ncbi:PAS domain-containing sensor histidine kinase [uncultured Draconibacterium sp.]|uniref:sensor histidine kinase n=1 Tax=uncultured Draconibacterium sp. TaxID=1573823 RepID=UPI003261B90B
MNHNLDSNTNNKNTTHKNLKILNDLNLPAIFENTNDSVWAINTAYEILYVNHVFAAAFYASFGSKLQTGSNLLYSLPQPLQAVWKSRYDRALNNESFSFIDHVAAENVSLYIEVFMNPIVINDEVVGALFFGKDITRRKLDEQRIKESQLLLKASIESQKDTILFSINKNYEYLYYNSAHARVMKIAYDEEIKAGMNILDCITNDADRVAAKENYDRALRGETHTNIRQYGDEHMAYYESFFNPIINEQGEIIGASGLARDISERIIAEKDLRKSEQNLKDLNATKDKLFSIIAHDLRSPFNSIMGFSEILLDKINDPTFTEAEKYLKYINTAANDTLTLLDNLLSWAKSQTGLLHIRPRTTRLSAHILDEINQKKLVAKAKNIALNNSASEELEVFADENMLRIVLRNLISNAIKFTQKGGEIRVFAGKTADGVEISIADNGIGINDETLQKLFNPTLQASQTGTANEKGSGLGLLLCKELIEKHGGKIAVESTAGKGSTFTFFLPDKK